MFPSHLLPRWWWWWWCGQRSVSPPRQYLYRVRVFGPSPPSPSPRQLKLKFDQTNNIFDTCLLGAHGSNLGKKYLDTQFGTNVVTVISPHQAQSSGPAPGWLVVIVIEIL